MNSRESHSCQPETQPHLFGADVPALTQQGSTEQPSSRLEVIERVYENADAQMLCRYRLVLFEVGNEVDTFGAWQVTARFESVWGSLDIHGKKALGGLFSHALADGVIVEAGIGKRPNGNIAAVYRLKK